jgi:nucleotide-binding universal stress UspA family protein
MRVLIAYDGSERSEAALDDLRRAGLGNHVQADLLAVAEVWLPPAGSCSGPSLMEAALREVIAKGRRDLDELTRQAEAATGRLRTLFPEWKVATHVKIGPAALRIMECAERSAADLVVVGSQAHLVLDRLAVGSVALRLLTHLPIPVRVARASHRRRSEAVRIAVAVDGSADANAAVAAMAAREWAPGTKAHVITSVHHPAIAFAEPAGVIPPGPFTASGAENIANVAAGKLRLAGLDTSAHVVCGDPKHSVIATAREWDADCIFVGARGLSGVERFILGSVSTSVAMHAHCSVEVVHVKTVM